MTRSEVMGDGLDGEGRAASKMAPPTVSPSFNVESRNSQQRFHCFPHLDLHLLACACEMSDLHVTHVSILLPTNRPETTHFVSSVWTGKQTLAKVSICKFHISRWQQIL
jgi:hypothetical protein